MYFFVTPFWAGSVLALGGPPVPLVKFEKYLVKNEAQERAKIVFYLEATNPNPATSFYLGGLCESSMGNYVMDILEVETVKLEEEQKEQFRISVEVPKRAILEYLYTQEAPSLSQIPVDGTLKIWLPNQSNN